MGERRLGSIVLILVTAAVVAAVPVSRAVEPAERFARVGFVAPGSPSSIPQGSKRNLGYSSTDVIANLDKFVCRGPAISVGMPDFTDKLTLEQVEKIKAFIQGTADVIRPKN